MAKLDYVSIPGKLGLSYSKLNLLSACPRKFELQEIQNCGESFSSVDTDYGHFVGAGIQGLFQFSGNLPRALVYAFSFWNQELDAIKPRDNKYLGTAVRAVEYFAEVYYPSLLSSGYRYWPHGIETFFLIHLTEKYFFQGHVDLILLNPEGALELFEIKTSTYAIHEFSWANSSQTNGYLAMLPFLAQKYNLPFSTRVNYLIQNPKEIFNPDESCGYKILPFDKTVEDGIEWVQSTLLRTIQLDSYFEYNLFPKEGKSCYEFYRPCQFFGVCGLRSLSPETTSRYAIKDISSIEIVVTLDQLLNYLRSHHV